MHHFVLFEVKMNVIVPNESRIEAEKHDNVTIVCDFNRDARPTPLVTWLFNGKPIKESDSIYSELNNALTIRYVEYSDSGNYTCILSNGYHPEQKFVYRLQVSGICLSIHCYEKEPNTFQLNSFPPFLSRTILFVLFFRD